MQQVSVVYVQLHNPSSQKLCQSSPRETFSYVFMTFLLLLEVGYAIQAEECALHAGCLHDQSKSESLSMLATSYLLKKYCLKGNIKSPFCPQYQPTVYSFPTV